MIQYIELSIKSLSHRKMRTFLTLLGVIIGITAVVSMISIGEGMKVSLEEALGVLGTDKIIVSPKFTHGVLGEGFKDADSDAIMDIPGVNFVSPMVSVSANGEFKGEEKTVTIWGLEPEKAEKTYAGASGYRMKEGRWLRKGDRSKICIGYTIHDDYFGRRVNVGNTMKIKGQAFEVIGVFQKTGDRDSDMAIYADLDQIRELFGMEEKLTMIVVRIKRGHDIEDVRRRIEALLEKRREEKDFVVITPKQIVEQVGAAFRVVQVVFGGIAAVSLIVGGIGIANTMIMNVIERTREIGIMKATGASHLHVMKVFLFESGVIGVVGGSIGVFFGYIISRLINITADRYLGEGILTTHVNVQMVAFALSFSFIIGILSGIYPAYRAVKLDPVEALRA